MRRRNHLQVNTFPFLAVLLCAMGSLILILLVMDRRARLAALARGRDQIGQRVRERNEAIANKTREQARKQDAVTAAWTKKRADLEARLSAEQQALDAEARKVQARLADIARELRNEDDVVGKLRHNVQAEQTRLTRQEQALQEAQKEAVNLKTKLTSGERARHKLAADLVQLEQIIRDLQAARQKDAQTYSVIPYKGKTGDQRRPLYVECTGDGLLFHPDRTLLPDPSIPTLRDEITRRVGRIAEQRKAAGLKEERPYLMMLVRPQGIKRYYQVQAAIHELPIEFGYEFVDADWVLAVPSAPPPTAVASDTNPRPTPAPAPQPTTTTAPDGTQREFVSAPAPSGPDGGALMNNGPAGNGSSGTPGGITPGGGSGNSSGSVLNGQAAGTPGGIGLPGGGNAGGTPGSGGSSGAAANDSQGPALPGEVAVIRPQPAGNGPDLGPPAGGGQEPTSAPRLLASNSAGNSGTPNPDAPIPIPGNPLPPIAGSWTPSSEATRIATPSLIPRTGTTAGSGSGNGSTGSDGGGSSQGEGQGRGLSQGPAFRGPSGPGNSSRPPLLPARLSGDDTVVYVECLSDGVVVYPSGRSISIDSLNHSPAHNILYQIVKAKLERHRGDPARRHVRFLIHRDAERTFHLAYPALNALAVDKTRYTLQADDDVSRLITAE